ncbi:tail fiber protein [Pseudomonas abyssi]|uniref:Phage tail collar domain-containing protein n=1 Tax=Pseudomonas abyssi TaxID=170540 RepID=A0A395R2T4_9PSED|nr:tail fiber protein [Halopseudomonas gallaeciensis]RGP54408.1 hypothetical protein ASB58_11040 [Halopseudomonas gallaeciensis]
MSKVLEMWEHMPGVEVVYAVSATPPAGWLLCDGSPLTAGTADNLRDLLIANGNPFGVSGADPLLPDRSGESLPYIIKA